MEWELEFRRENQAHDNELFQGIKFHIDHFYLSFICWLVNNLGTLLITVLVAMIMLLLKKIPILKYYPNFCELFIKYNN